VKLERGSFSGYLYVEGGPGNGTSLSTGAL
jgi:hypothetical protein